MSWAYRHFVRPFLFAWDSEKIHNFTLRLLSSASHSPTARTICRGLFRAPPLPTQCFGIHFPNPVGLAAGMDKNAVALPLWSDFGFGFAEMGGVTAESQPGNPPPRMFRAKDEEALINRMGFNNHGADEMSTRLRDWKARGLWPTHPIAVNLGKSKLTPITKAAEDYARSFRALRDTADFFVINVSSPNTPHLRQLQDKAALKDILQALQEINPGKKPLLVKVAPDLSFEALDEIMALVIQLGISGIVATNTTIARPSLEESALNHPYRETGGLSGRPLRTRSTEVIGHLFRSGQGRVPIIGVGGIFSGEDAYAKILAGASLVQIYTGLVYEGPRIARDVVAGLSRCLEKDGWKNLNAAVGAGTVQGKSS